MEEALDISAYAFLWDGSEKTWVLYRVPCPAGSLLVPFNTTTRMTFEIDNEEVARHVALRMKYAGVPVWDAEARRE